jgi:tetratricopeptide (TPR) repeat protein
MLEQDPKDLVGLQNLATACTHVGKFDEAISCCDTVLALNHFDEYALKNKIFALEQLKKHSDVVSCCDTLLQKNQNDTWALDSKGLALAEQNKPQEALTYYDKSLQINPDDITALVNKALVLSFLQKYEDAISFYDRAQKLDKSLKVAAAKSEAYEKLGKEDEAFLAAQGMLVDDITKLIAKAKEKKMKIFDLYCLDEYLDLEAREKRHQEKISSRQELEN